MRTRFPRHDGIFRSDVAVKTLLPLAGVQLAPNKTERRGLDPAPSSSSAMSSDRLFLDRVARQHCPSPLHRRAQTIMGFSSATRKPDISTLPGVGHFYFALTYSCHSLRFTKRCDKFPARSVVWVKGEKQCAK